MGYPLEPSPDQMREIGEAALAFVIDHVSSLHEQPSWDLDGIDALTKRLRDAPPTDGAGIQAVLARLREAIPKSLNTAGPGYLAYIPGGGLFSAAIADLVADATNRFVGMAFPAPALAQIEWSALRWMLDEFGYPAEARGILTSGGSLSNFSAIVTARRATLGEDIARGTIYVQAQTHHSVAKSAMLAGIPERNIRTMPTTPRLRMDAAQLERLVAKDRDAGLRPFCVVASMGTTNTGAVDPIEEILPIATREDLWVHADAAYGGFFFLTERGKRILAGIDRADSITLDPHKGMFLPYGTGALLVRDGARLREAHTTEAGSTAYLQDLAAHEEIPSFAEYSPELSRDFRGLRVWLPLQLHGVQAFRDALDEKLDLTSFLYEQLCSVPGLDVLWEPELTIIAFRCGKDDARNRALLEAINASRRIFLSSTVIDGHFTLRACIVSHRTHRDRIEEAAEIIRRAVAATGS